MRGGGKVRCVALWEWGDLSWPVNNEAEMNGPVLLFDGECGLCQALMGFVLRRDRSGRIKVAALQGKAGQTLLQRAELPTEDFDSLVFFPEVSRNDVLLRTDGVVAVFSEISGGWRKVGRFLGIFPRGFRDGGYRVIAKSRRRIFGNPRPKGLSDAAWADRILP
jgi:predicted DCC family thiol-disulfide oxidoreductase YuxK